MGISKDLAMQLDNTFVGTGRKLVKIDVKEYFMLGEHPDILTTAAKAVDERVSGVFKKRLAFFLEKPVCGI